MDVSNLVSPLYCSVSSDFNSQPNLSDFDDRNLIQTPQSAASVYTRKGRLCYSRIHLLSNQIGRLKTKELNRIIQALLLVVTVLLLFSFVFFCLIPRHNLSFLNFWIKFSSCIVNFLNYFVIFSNDNNVINQ